MTDLVYTTYDPDTGKIISVLQCGAASQVETNLEGKTYISGYHNPDQYYIQDGAPVLISDDPSTESNKYNFDYSTKTWTLDLDQTANAIRIQRLKHLQSIDAVSAVRLTLLSDAQKQQLVDYRQALLDVPQQPGFPTTVTWPSKPDWL
jgi:hypothetical protein